MYFCYDCLREFDAPKEVEEKHALDSPPYEKIFVCPFCYSHYFTNKIKTHCKCCGSKLPKGKIDYCSDECAKKGKILWEKQVKYRKLQLISPLNIIIRELTAYNKANNTNYSYGQYVSIKEQEKNTKKCAKKRKNT